MPYGWLLCGVLVGMVCGYVWGTRRQRPQVSPVVAEVSEPEPIVESTFVAPVEPEPVPEPPPEFCVAAASRLYVLMQDCAIEDLSADLSLVELVVRLAEALKGRRSDWSMLPLITIIAELQADPRLYSARLEALLVAKLLESTKRNKHGDIVWLRTLYQEGTWHRRTAIMMGLADYWGYSRRDISKFRMGIT